MVINEVFNLMMSKSYMTAKQLKYNTKANILMTPFDYNQLLKYFDDNAGSNPQLISLNLEAFNKFKPRISECAELLSMINDYHELIADDATANKGPLSIRNANSIAISRIFSEIEGTLNIESVPTTRKLLDDIIVKERKPETSNEKIIHNMAKAMQFVHTCPEFNEDNLYKLYSLLSEDSLPEDSRLLPGNKYRHDDSISIDDYECCPATRIKSCMDSLFEMVNSNLNNAAMRRYLSHIAHYYIVYIHPYFDYNGRTARMVSYWIALLMNEQSLPPTISEAINQTKQEYYSALRETRNSHNDLTYFLLYLYKVSIKYFLTYKNIEEIENKLKNKSKTITDTDKNYMKKILISAKGKFLYFDFVKWSNTEMSKQAAFKILNAFESYGFLRSETNNSNKKLFEVNEEMITYKFDIN